MRKKIYFIHIIKILLLNTFRLASVSLLQCNNRGALIVPCLHKYRALGQDHGFLPRFIGGGDRRKDDPTSRQFCWWYSFPTAILPPLHRANEAERWLILGLGANRLVKSKPDFCASRSTKMHAEKVWEINYSIRDKLFVHSRMKMSLLFTQPHVIQDVHVFLFSVEEKENDQPFHLTRPLFLSWDCGIIPQKT